MAKKTLSQVIIEYMEESYEKDLLYKFSSKMVFEYCQTIFPKIGKTHVYGELTRLKKLGKITNLGEQVPDQRNATYFALSSVIDKITTPDKKSDGNKVMSVESPKTTPATVASNPFDKVNSTLGEILAKVNGLVNAYTEVTQDLRGLRKSTVSSSIETTLDIANLAEVINDRLSDLTKENSFIYRLRDDTGEFIDELKKDLPEEIIKLLPQLDYGSEDYKRGIRDGIKLAVEMKLNLPNV
jgi:hypothetical protein